MNNEEETKPLVVLEMANNHMGDPLHGKHIIEVLEEITQPYLSRLSFAIKFQFRELQTFIHDDYKGGDLKFVKRFEETVLTDQQWDGLITQTRSSNFSLIITPFDEPSVAKALKYDVDILKIASCSLADWPLIEKIAQANKEVIFSTAGANLENIDNMVAFFQNRKIDASLMHCVGLYPTPEDALNIGQIAFFKQRYSDVRVGYSTHESPEQLNTGAIAYAMGGRVFEKHVALETDDYAMNAYSVSPEQLGAWLKVLNSAIETVGQRNTKIENTAEEIKSLRGLQRAIFVKKNIKAGAIISEADVYFAIPAFEGTYVANDFSKYTTFEAVKDIPKDRPLTMDNAKSTDKRQFVRDIVDRVRTFLASTNVVVPDGRTLEISHHYGLKQFFATGLVMATVINEEYCKKLLIMLPRQEHPEQYHKKKKETFHVLYGEVILTLDDEKNTYGPGEVITIEPKVRHAFRSEAGCVIEEISSTHYVDDSYYTDNAITNSPNRKTFVTFWK